MLKRRDWKLLHRHDQEGSGSESSDDDSEETPNDPVDSQPSDDDGPVNPLQMPSASESESSDASSDADSPAATSDALAIAVRWLQPANDEADAGYALRCRVCPGKVLLSAASLRNHAASARHRKGLMQMIGEGRKDDVEAQAAAFCLSDAEEECETHEERLQRIAALAARVGGGEGGKGGKGSSGGKGGSGGEVAAGQAPQKVVEARTQKSPAALRRERRRKKREGGEKKRVRPGKRQRQAARGGGAAL